MFYLRAFLIPLIQLTPCILLFLFPYHDSLRFSKKTTLVIAGTALALFCLTLSAATGITSPLDSPKNVFHFWMTFYFFVILVASFLLFLLLTRGFWAAKLFIFVFSSSYSISLAAITNFFDQIIVNDPRPFAFSTIIFSCTACLISLPPVLYAERRYFIPIRQLIPERVWRILSLCTAVFLILFSIKILSFSWDPQSYFRLLVSFFSPIFTNVTTYAFLFLLMNEISENRILIDKTKYYAQFLDVQTRDYNKILDTLEKLRRTRHDVRHHMNVLLGLAAENPGADPGEQLADIRSYLKEYKEFYTAVPYSALCKNNIINVLVTHYLELSKEARIQFTYRIDLPDALPMEDAALCVLMGNLLENALEGSCTTPSGNGRIELNIAVIQHNLIITLDNTFDGRTKMKGTRYLTTKEKGSGIGIQSVRNITDSYHGTASFEPDKEIFRVSIRLPLDKSEKE